MSYNYPTALGASGLVSDTQGKLDSLINIFDLGAEPTNGHILSYNSTTKKIVAIANSGGGGGGSGIALTDLSVSTNSASGNGSLAYNNSTGVFTFTPADASGSGSGIALTDLSVNTASASGGGALAYNNSTGVFTFTPASPSGGSTFSDTIQAQGEVSIYCSDPGQDDGSQLVGALLTIRSTTSSFNSSTNQMNNDGADSNLAFRCNNILLQGSSNKLITNASIGDIEFRTQETASGSTGMIIKHDENQIEMKGVLQLDTQSSDPSTNLANGQMYYNTSTNKFRGYANGAWVDLH